MLLSAPRLHPRSLTCYLREGRSRRLGLGACEQMCHFLSLDVEKIRSRVPSRGIIPSINRSTHIDFNHARNFCVILVFCIAFLSASFAQHFTTSRADISRRGAVTNETLLT